MTSIIYHINNIEALMINVNLSEVSRIVLWRYLWNLRYHCEVFFEWSYIETWNRKVAGSNAARHSVSLSNTTWNEASLSLRVEQPLTSGGCPLSIRQSWLWGRHAQLSKVIIVILIMIIYYVLYLTTKKPEVISYAVKDNLYFIFNLKITFNYILT